MIERKIAIDEQKHVIIHALLAGTARATGLLKKVPELVRKRGWSDHPDLTYVLAVAVALKVIGIGGTIIRRPEYADTCGGLWPSSHWRVSAAWIVESLDLQDLVPPVQQLA